MDINDSDGRPLEGGTQAADPGHAEAALVAAVEVAGVSAEPERGMAAVAAADLEARISALEVAIADLRAEAHKDRIIGQNLGKISALEASVAATRDARATAMLHYDLVAGLVREYAGVAAGNDVATRGAALPDMQAVMSDLESHLLSLGLQPFGAEVADDAGGLRIVLATQRAVAVEDTGDVAQDYTVVRAVRAGFRDLEGGIVRKQDVVIRRCRETPAA